MLSNICTIAADVYLCVKYMFLLKVPMKQKIIAAYLKGFSKYRRMVFSFLEYLFFILEVMAFLCEIYDWAVF